jgi:dethiobiotin synthetase
MSPHAAARIDGLKIEIEKIKIPVSPNKLIIETAGGLMSPLNDTQTNLDFVIHFKLPVIVVSQNYLGSINHSLLTIEMLKAKGVLILGILFNGDENPETQKYILNYSGVPFLGRMNHYEELNKEAVLKEAEALRPAMVKLPKVRIL